MNAAAFNRLHTLRMENTEAGYRMADMRPRFNRMAGRHENGTAPVAVSAFQLFQTPKALAVRLVASLGLRGGERVLEPSAGLGRLLDALPLVGDVVAVELAPQCAVELQRQDRDRCRVLQRDFLTVTPAELGLFDAVVMNPPFHMRADIRHIKHAMTFLKPGGKLAAICMNTRHRVEALKPLASTWTELPSGEFKEAATNVPAVLLTISP